MTHASQHPDDEAVDRFAAAMKAKLTEARTKGRSGWENKTQVSAEALSEMLLAHVFKGDPRDVANLSMFLWERGERIALAVGHRLERAVEVFQLTEQECAERYARAGYLVEPGISVEAGLIAAAPFLIGRAAVPASLEDLRDRLLAPREIARDEDGWLTHPDMPICDEGVRYNDLLAVFGIEAGFSSMEDQDELLADQYFDGTGSAADWNPEPPPGDGWVLLEIYDTESGPYAMFGRPLLPEAWPRRNGEPFNFRTHLARQAQFSRRTFGPGRRTQGVCDHIRKELLEIEAAPNDLEEWIDVAILALDGAWRTGASPDQIIATLTAKQAKNEARTWPDWRTADPNKAIEHSKAPAT